MVSDAGRPSSGHRRLQSPRPYAVIYMQLRLNALLFDLRNLSKGFAKDVPSVWPKLGELVLGF